MDDIQPDPEFNPEANQPTTVQWVLIGLVGLIVVCGVALFLYGGAFTAYSWYTSQQVKVTETAAAATAIVMERDQIMIEASNWPLVMFDTFDDNESGWIDGEIDDQYSSIQVTINGVYRWQATAKQGFHWRVWPGADYTTDFYLAVDAQNLSENSEAQYGLIFRNNDDAYFYWEVADTQYFRVFSYDNEWNELIPSSYAETIRPGAENHLVVVSVDDKFYFWINDQFVGEASGSYPLEGDVGVAIGLSYEGEESTIIFDNFELRALTTEE